MPTLGSGQTGYLEGGAGKGDTMGMIGNDHYRYGTQPACRQCRRRDRRAIDRGRQFCQSEELHNHAPYPVVVVGRRPNR